MPSTSPSRAPTQIAEITLNANYDVLIGNNKGQFLKECSAKYPADCIDVRRGSVIITLGGTPSEIDQTVTEINDAGAIDLPSFGSMTLKVEEEEKSASLLWLWILLPLLSLCLILIAVYFYCFNKQDEQKQSRKEDPFGVDYTNTRRAPENLNKL